jgi:2-iminobutanoate/2-iminopropanoate deaminase
MNQPEFRAPRHIHPGNIPKPAGPYSPVVVAGGFVYLCGQGPNDAAGNRAEDFESQARQCFTNIGRCLESAGATFADVVKVGGFLADWADFKTFNEVYLEFFSEPYPVRTTVPVSLPRILIEVDCVAYLPARIGESAAR